MNGGYVDTHCHLISHRYGDEAVAVAARSLRRGVRMLAVAADAASSRAGVSLAGRCPGVRAAVGVHPTEAAELDEETWRGVEDLAALPAVAAVGETGLDYHWPDCPPDIQKKWFVRHMELALAVDKPVSVHARSSVRDTLAMLEPFLARGMRAIWHCCTAGKKDIGWAMDFAVEHGVYLGFGGLVTFEDQKPLRSQAQRIPERLLLLETDAPYLAPHPKTTDRNEPSGVIRVAEVLAALRGAGAEAVRAATTENARRLLGDWVIGEGEEAAEF